ncbi:MAG: hypothetical protein RLP44_27400 [Aggregatilineales bacterium]
MNLHSNLMTQWKLRYCKTRMVAFINGDLPEKSRRRIGRYIDDCPACYDEYVNQRRALQELKPELKRVGMPRPEQLDRIWNAIQTEMTPEMSKPVSRPPARARLAYQRTSYAVAMLVTILLVVVPLMLGNSGVSLAADTTLPEPAQRLTLARTDAPEDNVQSVAAATAEANIITTENLGTTLQATPRPVLEPGENN